ncbi:MAG: hypothetical protein PHV93_01155 [Candidatus Pacebacteria bacterium]|nr:hypothetical protein [Candidatus Paceibacterota bacterium]
MEEGQFRDVPLSYAGVSGEYKVSISSEREGEKQVTLDPIEGKGDRFWRIFANITTFQGKTEISLHVWTPSDEWKFVHYRVYDNGKEKSVRKQGGRFSKEELKSAKALLKQALADVENDEHRRPTQVSEP